MTELPTDPIELGLTADGLIRLCDESLARAKSLAEGIRSLKDAESLTWEQTFGAFDALTHAVQEAVSVPALMMVGHPDATVRAAAATCEPKVDAFASALYVDDAIASVLRRFAKIGEPLSPVHARFVEHTLRDYRRNGLDLPTEGRERLRQLNERITVVGQTYEKNLAETSLAIEVVPAQLEGLPAPYIASHPVQANGAVRISTDYPDLVPFIKYAKDRVAAVELYALSQNRCTEENLPLLDELIRLRKEKATLLRYPTWADYVLEPRMAKSSATVKTFLERLHTGLKPKREEEFVAFKEMAVSLDMNVNDGVSASDSAYLEELIRREKFAIDSQALSEYFEVRAVQQGILDISSHLYGITFRPVAVPVWHEDVTPFEIREASSGALIGQVYLDLYPREGKYKHAAVFPLRETMTLPDGSRLLPIGALVCNFPKPGASPALLSHEEVVTFFHEFGHLLHHALSTSELTAFGGTNVARDFVEAPSQMFEEWAWSRETLDLFAKHHATGARLPDTLFNAMTAARTFGEAIFTERQLFLATLDQTYYTREPGFDTTAVMEELSKEFSSFTRVPNTHFQASFGHLVGYDAAYYGYQWALSLAFDLLTRFQKEGLMNTQTSKEYRAAILSPGGSEDEEQMVKTFLGRPSSPDAYLAYLGIETA